MPVETAIYIADLNPAYPEHTDGLGAADSHMRLIKQVLQDTFPNLGDTAITATGADINVLTGGQLVDETTGSLTAPVPTGSTTLGGTLILKGAPASPTPYLDINLSNIEGGLAISSGSTLLMLMDPAGNFTLNESLNATLLKQNGHAVMPTGGIIMWAGSVASIPSGFFLCNGSNGTPDMRNLFVVGAGSTYTPGQTGGSLTDSETVSSAGSHSHGGATGSGGAQALAGAATTDGAHQHTGQTDGYALTVGDIPPHAHGIALGNGPSFGANASGTFGGIAGSTTTDNGSGGGNAHSHGIEVDGSHTHTIAVQSVNNHTHGISTDGSHSHTVTVNTVPPFYAVCYIMFGG